MRKPRPRAEAVILIMVFSLLAISTACNSKRLPPASTSVPEPFGPQFNAKAIPNLPPEYSISTPIWPWQNGIPAKPIANAPRFIDYPPPDLAFDLALLAEAGCTTSTTSDFYLDCTPPSPLLSFGCDILTLPHPPGINSGLDPDYPVIATCGHLQPSGSSATNPAEAYLYRAGCLDRFNMSYIIKVDDQLVQANSAAIMIGLFAPIDSPTEAISYAQMLTGMQAVYSFDLGRNRTVFYQAVITGTHATEMNGQYTVHLYHTEVCGCETYLTSQVDIIVGYDGTISWGEAIPVYLIASPGCRD